MEKKRNSFIIPLYCFGIIAVFAAVLIIPAARAWFEGATAEHPFIMGFFKFAFGFHYICIHVSVLLYLWFLMNDSIHQ